MSSSIIEIIHHEVPETTRPKFIIDNELNPKMPPEYALLQNMNNNFSAAFVGRPGSGKTSLLHSFLSSRKIFKRVFDLIIVFMPESSMQSMKQCCLSGLPREQIFHEISDSNLRKAKKMILATRDLRKGKAQVLCIFDDLQSQYKDYERKLLHWSSNRRHMHLSLAFIMQSYKKCPRSMRQGFSDIFTFRPSRGDLDDMYRELCTISKGEWQQIIDIYNDDENERSFLYLHPATQRYFVNYDELRPTSVE